MHAHMHTYMQKLAPLYHCIDVTADKYKKKKFACVKSKELNFSIKLETLLKNRAANYNFKEKMSFSLISGRLDSQ